MRISVIIPVHNRQSSAVEAIRAAAAQSLAPLEIIVVDDASDPPLVLSDELSEAVEIRLIRHETNQGPSAARNSGIAAARGDWIAFLDSDDLWTGRKLEDQAAFIASLRNPRERPLTACATGFERRRTGSDRAERLYPIAGRSLTQFSSGCWFCPGSTLLIEKAAFDRIGPFDISLRRLEDFDWFLRFSLAGGRLEVAPLIGSVVNVGGRPRPEIVEHASRILRERWCGEDSPLPDAGARRRVGAYLDLECASSNHYAGQRWRGGMHLMRSLLAAPRLGLSLADWWRSRPDGLGG